MGGVGVDPKVVGKCASWRVTHGQVGSPSVEGGGHAGIWIPALTRVGIPEVWASTESCAEQGRT